MHACLQGRKALVTGSSRQTTHTALSKSVDAAEKFADSGTDDEDDCDMTGDALWCDDKIWASVVSSLSTTNSFCGSSKGKVVIFQ